VGVHVGRAAMTGTAGFDGVDPAASGREWFRECYGAWPAGVWHAPGRVNLIGEHTDYNEGFVLPFALGLGVRAAASRRSADVLELCSRQAPAHTDPAGRSAASGRVTVRLGSLVPGSVNGWAAYAAGVAWALRDAGYGIGGARLAIDADLPQGAGLSSSAALECSVAVALTGLYGVDVPAHALAKLARRAENDFVGIPSGIMDQSAALLCRRGHALLLDCRTLATSQVPFDPAGAGLALAVIDTRVRHKLGESAYAERRAACEEAARLLGVAALRDVTNADAALRLLKDSVLCRRARHVITDNHRVQAVVGLLRAGAMSEVGSVLTESHLSLRDDFEISWPQADVACSAACAAGAFGARMIGGGFGGSVIALVPVDQTAKIVDAVAAEFTRRRWAAPAVIPASPESGARRLV